MSQPADPTPETTRSPLSGCAILIIVCAMMVFLVGLAIVVPFIQGNAMEKFTSTQPAPVEVTALNGSEIALSERLVTFNRQLDTKESATLALTAEDLNLAIAAYEPFKDLRGTFRIREITAKNLRIEVSYQLNGKPRFAREDEKSWISSDFRYLNATFVARPVLQKGEVVLQIDSIEVPGKEIPPQFVDRMSPYQIMERYIIHPVIGPAMKKLTRVELVDGAVLLKYLPGETPVDQITNAQVDSGTSRLFTFLGYAACVFLFFVTLVLIIGLWAKKRRG